MAVKYCCIEKCNSSTIRREDIGVTFHKFPKDDILRNVWLNSTKHVDKEIDAIYYVCSRHFRKYDFENYKESKYILKSDAVPTIFPWSIELMENNKITETNMDTSTTESTEDEPIITVSQNIAPDDDSDGNKAGIDEKEENHESTSGNLNIEIKLDCNNKMENIDTVDIPTSSLMDLLTNKDKESKELSNNDLFPAEKVNGSIALSVGSRVEAKDFGEMWHPAQITEVDYDEMEVLVCYDNMKRNAEWINVSSPRLRSHTSPAKEVVELEKKSVEMAPVPKLKMMFKVGERCLARYKDNCRFTATIRTVLGDGEYEILFDDGTPWTCNVARLFKTKQESEGMNSASPLHEVPQLPSKSSSNISPRSSPASVDSRTNTPTPNTSVPFHTHLFDPTRDYLGPKSERRELKRKLNIKVLFNIGQKRKKSNKKHEIVKNVKVKSKSKIKKITSNSRTASASKASYSSKMPLLVIEDIKRQDNTNIAIGDSADEKDVEKIDTVTDNDDTNVNFTEMVPDELKLEKFEQINEEKHEETICKIKQAISKLEVGLSSLNSMDTSNESKIKFEKIEEKAEKIEEQHIKIENSDSDKVFEEPEKDIKLSEKKLEQSEISIQQPENKETESQSTVSVKISEDDIILKKQRYNKIKKAKKLRLLRENKVKKAVERVKNELEEMKRQVEEMKKQVNMKTMFSNIDAVDAKKSTMSEHDIDNRFIMAGKWCCKWVNDQPQGIVQEPRVEANNRHGLTRFTVEVEDKRLPPLWKKHLVRRSLGNSAGKWDITIVSPDNRQLHTKASMKAYLETINDDSLKPYEYALLDYGIHRKLSRRMGWDDRVLASSFSNDSLMKSKKTSLKRHIRMKPGPPSKKSRNHDASITNKSASTSVSDGNVADVNSSSSPGLPFDNSTLEDGYVYVGSLKVQIIENLLRCPAEGCYKNFRNNTLLQMHIKHYHRELTKMMGATPKVQDLAYARAAPSEPETDMKTSKPKIPKAKRIETESKIELSDLGHEPVDVGLHHIADYEKIPRSLNSPKLRQALISSKPVKRPRVLLPVRRPEDQPTKSIELLKKDQPDDLDESCFREEFERKYIAPNTDNDEQLDFEAAISIHTVPKIVTDRKKKDKKPKLPTSQKAKFSEEDDWCSDIDSRSSYQRSGSPDSKSLDYKSGDCSNQLLLDPMEEGELYFTTETGEKIKIVHMKREEIINCHCGFREEDGLMIQCELCLCWQHALCHNIQRESEVPEKYTCSICLNPRRGRRSQRFLHDQDRLYEGLLPGAKPCEALRRSHELSGNLLRIDDALHALRLKYYVATKKGHPKLYLWAKDWENGELSDRLNTEYVHLNAIISHIGKENLPLKEDDLKDTSLSDIRMPSSEDADHQRFTQKSGESNLGSQTLLTNLLSSPGGTSLDLPISTTELERWANTVQESELGNNRSGSTSGPQPEAPIENSVCRERLLKHIQRCQAIIDARLDSIEAQVAELESQDPSFEDDETADFFPRTKQSIQMLLRDLDTMEELGVIT